MNTDTLAKLVSDVVMGTLGDTAKYYPCVGAVRNVQVFLRRPERVIPGLADTRLENTGCVIEIQRSQLTVDPQKGDKLQVQEKTYRVKSAKPTASSVLWELSCDAA